MAVLSGPNIADEIARDLPAAAVIASDDEQLALDLQAAINSVTFRVYSSDDMIGVELCAAAKNVIALAAGGADGLSLGDNAKAALVARGLAEMARLAVAAGGKEETFAGLAGMGDLVVTCWSPVGRNRRAGELIAQGVEPDEAVRQIGMTVEGSDDRARAARPLAPARDRAADHERRLRGARRRASARARRQPDAPPADDRVALLAVPLGGHLPIGDEKSPSFEGNVCRNVAKPLQSPMTGVASPVR